jgi:hypothetical protein
MTDEQINAAIARALNADEHWMIQKNYCADLNAMHEAEKMLTDTNMFVMAHHIERLVSAKGQHYFHATARQRAEAFLKTLGK